MPSVFEIKSVLFSVLVLEITYTIHSHWNIFYEPGSYKLMEFMGQQQRSRDQIPNKLDMC